MIFKPELVRLIHQGKKRQTRRPVRPGVPCRYKTGKVYAVQPGRSKEAALYITITEVREEALDDITLSDAQREGFRTTGEFVDYWTALYGGYDPAQRVWVLTFVQGDVTDRPRLLAARPGGPGGDYTDNPARAAKGEPEAIPLKLQERYATDGRENHKMTLAARQERLYAVIADLQEQAKQYQDVAKDRSVRRRLRSAQHHLDALKIEIGKRVA